MIQTTRFSRELVQDTRVRYRDKRVRREKVNALYQKFGAEEVRFDGKVIGWRVDKEFICVKRSFKTEADAMLILEISKTYKNSYKCKEVYQCPKCNQWHATSKGHLAGTRK